MGTLRNMFCQLLIIKNHFASSLVGVISLLEDNNGGRRTNNLKNVLSSANYLDSLFFPFWCWESSASCGRKTEEQELKT